MLDFSFHLNLLPRFAFAGNKRVTYVRVLSSIKIFRLNLGNCEKQFLSWRIQFGGDTNQLVEPPFYIVKKLSTLLEIEFTIVKCSSSCGFLSAANETWRRFSFGANSSSPTRKFWNTSKISFLRLVPKNDYKVVMLQLKKTGAFLMKKFYSKKKMLHNRYVNFSPTFPLVQHWPRKLLNNIIK